MKLFVDVMRHAHAEKIEGMDRHLNLYRPLSAKGIGQAFAARKLYEDETTKIKGVIHSPAPRALCTAAIAIGEAKPQFIRMDSLWVQRDEVENDGELLWHAFDLYDYDIEAYLKDPEALAALHRYGKRVAEEMTKLNDAPKMSEGDVAIIVGHAVFQNFVAHHLVKIASGQEDETLLHIAFNEAERVRLTFEGGLGDEKVKYLGFTRSQPPVVQPSSS